MTKDLQERLRRLGVVKGTRKLKPAPLSTPSRSRPFSEPSLERPADPDPDEIVPLPQLLPGGRLEVTAAGACYLFDKIYPLTWRHGDERLGALLAYLPETAVSFGQDTRFAGTTFRDFLFIDTETTGLAGAGVFAFMVGVAFFEDDALVVRQFFLRDHGDEPAMLLLLAELLAQKVGVITFNGRSFDLPLLDNRYLMNRMPTDLLNKPHLDLLSPARRLWRQRLGSCALSNLEKLLLGVSRTQADVPGWFIPTLYQHYLRTGDARELVRVFYHNEIDMLSMVTLTSRILQLWTAAKPIDEAVDLYSVGKWQLDLGLLAQGEQHLRWALQGELPLDVYHKALYRLGGTLKRQERRLEAVALWQQIATTSFDDIGAHVELAKYFEWQVQELETAVVWTQQALALVDTWRDGRRAVVIQAKLQHRLARLQRKLEQNP